MNNNITFMIASIILTGMLGMIAFLIKGFIIDLKKMNISTAVQNQQLSNILLQVNDIKKGMEEIHTMRIQMERNSTLVEGMQNQTGEIKKQLYDNSRDIITIKDDITHIFKELKRE